MALSLRFLAPVVEAEIARVQRKIGEAVARHRSLRSLTQEAAAERAGLDVRYWQRIEAGSVNVTVRTLVRVALAIGASVCDLVVDC
jgi:transcriptional regulator with XRE-family HTH domain